MAQLMENSLLVYDKFVRGAYSISDYTSKRYKQILKLDILNDVDMVMPYVLEDNEFLDLVSYKIYGNEKYWDMLLIINNKDPLFDLAYSFDTIKDDSILEVNNYLANVYRGGVSQDRYDALVNDVFVEKYVENELNRTIKVINASRLPDFIRILRQNGFIV